MKFDWKALWEAVKEPLRWVVLAIIPFLIAYFGGLNYVWAGLVTTILRIIDKYMHEHADTGVAGGLVKF